VNQQSPDKGLEKDYSDQSDKARQAALLQAKHYTRQIEESFENAKSSNDAATKVLELDYAKQTLKELQELLKQNPSVKLTTLTSAEVKIAELDAAFEQAGLRQIGSKSTPEPVSVAAEPTVHGKIGFLCPHCSVEVTASGNSIGQQFQCPECQAVGIIPNPEETHSPVPQQVALVSEHPTPISVGTSDNPGVPMVNLGCSLMSLGCLISVLAPIAIVVFLIAMGIFSG
jgi:hypothetical protein